MGIDVGWRRLPCLSWNHRRHVRHCAARLHNFTVQEIGDDLDELIALTRTINPRLRFILTVSPVPLVATATDEHVLLATIYSKSVLRVAAGEAARRQKDVVYFPAYEIVTGPQAPHDFFEADRREPSQRAIRHVMSAFLANCETSYRIALDVPNEPNPRATPKNNPASPGPAVTPSELLEDPLLRLSKIIADAECEEAAAGVGVED